LSDLAASIIDGRLFRQVNFLSLLNNREEKIRCALLIEGSTSSLSSSNVDRRAIQGAILQISLFKGIPILRAMNPRESARIMAYAGNQNERMKIPKHVTISTGKFVHNKRRAQLMLLQSLPGVGPERANELLKTFGSVNKILQATEKELAETKYIGKTTAQKIKWVVCEAAPAYQV
jgi:ERCC4-type nuclease